MNDMPTVLCDPRMPADWDERERRLALEVQTEIARRDQLTEPEILDMFRRAVTP